MAFPRPAALPLPPAGTVVGRDWLAEHGAADDEVSGRHVQLLGDRRSLHVADVGSRNGTWLHGRALPPGEPGQLTDGTVLRMGRTLLVYREGLEGPLAPSPPIGELVGPYGLRAVADAIDALRRQAPGNVLIEGETGTGKELAAAAVAEALGRPRPFQAVNVAGVASGVFESQLFGHVAGAFSDARRSSPGIIAAHAGGTVFLDEIGELPLDLQPKLLRLVENREILAVGAERSSHADVLLVAATNRSLEQMVEQGTFRRDLHARLALAAIQLPPLRERAEDIFAVAQAVGARSGIALDPDDPGVEAEAVERLLLDPWPSNVRGLIATLGRARALDPAPGLRLWAVERILGPSLPSPPGQLSREMVQAALDASAGNEAQAARRLGVSRGKLRRFLGKA
ncbi:MAG: sigma 54-interacting transcriptional regulator [Deltaproteobacteria bacterium]|nr:sigma 54-interacting transcriptional regulator [Deltaproteobacteria bacterium]